MRTPREILLKRHGAAESKLEVICEQVGCKHLVRESVHETGGQHVRAPMRWRDFFDLPRPAWAGLAAAWIVIIALNVASSETSSSSSPALAAAVTPRSPEMLQALREQKRLFAELVGSLGEASEADTRRFVPRPRSEVSRKTSIA